MAPRPVTGMLEAWADRPVNSRNRASQSTRVKARIHGPGGHATNLLTTFAAREHATVRRRENPNRTPAIED